MRILDNNKYRDMTPEEETAYLEMASEEANI